MVNFINKVYIKYFIKTDTKKTDRKDLSGGEKSCLAILILMAL